MVKSRNILVPIRLRDDEAELLQAAADSVGMHRSTYIRAIVLVEAQRRVPGFGDLPLADRVLR